MPTLEEKIGYHFRNGRLLETALTHSSRANEAKGGGQSNERLEFLGDSVLSYVVADHLYATAKKLPEGELTRQRAALVCEGALAGFARQIGLGAHLRLGKGEEKGGGRQRDSILSDAFEALIAAICLDGGIEEARRFILPFILRARPAGDDYKTQLQEVIQQNPEERLRYAVVAEEGPDHDKRFTVEVYLNANETAIGRGVAKSKKQAEQHAARRALALMGLVPDEEGKGGEECT